MRKGSVFFGIFIFVTASVMSTFAQGDATFTGTVMSFGSGRNTRTTTAPFTMRVTGVTSDIQAARYLTVLQDGGQDDLLRTVQNENLGFFASGGRVGDALNIVRVSDIDGKRMIRAVFERRINIAEFRYGHRSTDYPFGYVELIVDPKTGRGDGTYISAAQIRVRKDRRTGVETVEIESFATFPSRLMGVRMRGANVP